MSMKIVCGFLMALFFTAMPLYAQDQPPGDAHQPLSADEIVSRMQSKLSLTQDQVTAITPIIEKYTSKREELKQGVEDGTIERSDMRNQMKQMKADEQQELSQVLSADQLSQWEQMMSQRRHKNSEEQTQRNETEGTGNIGEGGGNGGS
jgi:Skp family chaperone for outer membrane proteins